MHARWAPPATPRSEQLLPVITVLSGTLRGQAGHPRPGALSGLDPFKKEIEGIGSEGVATVCYAE